MAKRKWKDWPKDFGSRLNSTGGAVGLIGLGVGAAAFLTPVGWVASTILVGSGITVASSLAWAALTSIPPKLADPDALIGKKFNVDDLRKVDPPLRRLGLVGPGFTGKSTLIDHIRLSPVADERTETVYAVVVALPTSPVSYLALIDGAGGEFVQQFRVTEYSDVLTIILDHNASNKLDSVDSDRLAEHDEFLAQLKGYIRDKHGQRPRHIHFLLNKQDLWDGSADRPMLLLWFDEQVKMWRESGLASQVTKAYHSNMRPGSVTAFIQKILGNI